MAETKMKSCLFRDGGLKDRAPALNLSYLVLKLAVCYNWPMGPRDKVHNRRRWFCRSGLVLLSVAGVVAVGLAGSSGLIAYMALHPLSRSSPTPTGMNTSAFLEIQFTTLDGLTLRGWHLPGRDNATVILIHGFARDRSELLLEAQWLTEQGFGTLLFDTRAQGVSGGAHIGLGYSERLDVRAAVNFLRAKSPNEIIGIMGYSMGAVAAIQAAAADSRIRAVLAVSPYADLRQLVNHQLGLARALAPLIMWWGEKMTGTRIADFDPLSAVAALAPRPILIMEAGNDAVLPPKSGRLLYEAASDPKQLWSVPGIPHVGFAQTTPDAYRQRILDFFQDTLLLDQAAP
jgi:alpha-beta hydrolase superfamily lysophospholipase